MDSATDTFRPVQLHGHAHVNRWQGAWQQQGRQAASSRTSQQVAAAPCSVWSVCAQLASALQTHVVLQVLMHGCQLLSPCRAVC